MKRYIVCDNTGPLMLGHYEDTPRGGVLVHGDTAQAMPYQTARRAMRRTAEYAAERGFKWDCHRQRMFRVSPNTCRQVRRESEQENV